MTTRLTYTLREVAELTGIPVRALQRDCWAKRIDHVDPGPGRAKLLTPEHVAQMINRYTVTSTTTDDLTALRVRRARRLAKS